MESITLHFVKEKDTKNTVRFKEVRDGGWAAGERPVVGTLYVNKDVARDVSAVRVTIECERVGSREA